MTLFKKLFSPIKSFLNKYHIVFNYYFLSISFMLFFTFILIKIIGSNILAHEEYVLKKEFIKRNYQFTQKIANRIAKYFENLDTLSIVDLIDQISKSDDVVYAYVLNSKGEVIAHSVKSEMFKKYKDKFLNNENLSFFINNSTRVWYKERIFKGENIIKFSKPIILQFVKEKALEELKKFNKDSNGNILLDNKKNNNKLSNQFYIAGVLHIAFSMKKLRLISYYSHKRVSIYYYISYIIAILLGFFIGKFLEKSLFQANRTLKDIIDERETEPIKIDNRFDSFKRLFFLINNLIFKIKEYILKEEKIINDIKIVNDNLTLQIINHINEGIIIVNEVLKVEYINKKFLSFIKKDIKEVLNENLAEVFNNNLNIFDEINKVLTDDFKTSQIILVENIKFQILPVVGDNELKKVVILLLNDIDNSPSKKHKKVTKEKREDKKSTEQQKKEKNNEKSRITSRLRRI